MLKKTALDLGLFEEDYINFVEKVREKGNFSAHIASRQSEARRKWDIETRPLFENWEKENANRYKAGLPIKPPPITHGYKRWTSQSEARQVLIDTKNILVKIIQNYFRN